MKRDHWQRHIASLDPEVDFEEISRIVGFYEFPWDLEQALSFALFRTYAVPSIGGLLYDTGEFTERTQKRHDDTALVLEAIAIDGMESEGGRTAVRRMNQMHGSYGIANDDMLYVLSTFVVTPIRWIRDFGWRTGTDDERLAAVRYYQRLGALMGIRGVPDDFEGFEQLMDDYEAQHFRPDPKTRAVADSTLELFANFYPRIFAPAMRVFGRCLMDDHLLDAFEYPHPPHLLKAMARGSLRMRARIVRWMPPRQKPRLARDSNRIRSYPGGFMIEHLGTFPAAIPAEDRAV